MKKPVAFEKHSRATAQSLTEALTPGSELLRDPAWRWLRENARIIRTAIRALKEARVSFREFPVVDDTGNGAVPRAFLVAREYLRKQRWCFSEHTLTNHLDSLQMDTPLFMGELWGVRPMLQAALLDELDAAIKERQPERLPVLIDSLRHISSAEWKEWFESVSIVDRILRHDPAGAYEEMDYETRDMYRSAITELARFSVHDELKIANLAVELAREGAGRAGHVGYYLIDRGLERLRQRVGYKPPLGQRLVDSVANHPSAFYLVGVEVITFATVFLLLSGLDVLTPIAAGLLLLLIPATQSAVEFMNSLTSTLVKPRRLAKLDFSGGIPDEYATMVAIPTLLLSDHQVEQLADDLEVRYLANPDDNLYFALLTDPPDSASQPVDERDELVALCTSLIEGLNRKYAGTNPGPFYLFHRHRIFNPSENTWMGWERKRGKLLDLNKLLREDYDSFPVKIGDLSVLPRIKYVITLDSDTQLPRDAAHRLVGTIAHPLNRAVVDPATNMVVEGYGILQPRVGISVQSASRSRLANIYSGQTGFDIYTRAVSDVYQDLYGEGSFTGKGIYDVDALRTSLEHRFPCNALLSHDLIEGAYARAGLVSDVEVIDDYPSHFSAYSRRKHRWVRGDWQIMQWLLPKVPDYFDRLVPNPTTLISRWKLLDNLRRSLIDPATFLLFLAGWMYLPGGAVYWTTAVLTLLLIPTYAQLGFTLGGIAGVRNIKPFLTETAWSFVKGHASVFLNLVFLAHQSLLAVDAIGRTLIRSTITRKKMLEWETAAQAESGALKKTVDLYLDWTPILSLVIAVVLSFWKPESMVAALPILLMWSVSKSISLWLNLPPSGRKRSVNEQDQEFLRLSALRTWRYFREFSNDANHWLIPDNVQETPAAVAHRLSPTNLGMLLNARQAAYEFGYLTLPEFARLTRLTLTTAGHMPRHLGHFWNWYDTRSLQPLEPRFISTVDSGNLAGSLWTLKQGCLAMTKHASQRPVLIQGLRDHLLLLSELAPDHVRALQVIFQKLTETPESWRAELPALRMEAERIAAIVREENEEAEWWANELAARAQAMAELPAAVEPVVGENLLSIAEIADRLAAEMSFRPLYEPKKKLLSVGYSAETATLEPSYYDLLASEARMASFVAVAKGDIPQQGWFHLGRTQMLYHGERILLSWTGTMFEYLMPSLWMKVYPDTLMEQSMQAAVAAQRGYCSRRGVPWGISEAAYSRTDQEGVYQYKAFGVPALGLKQDVDDTLVIAPYASFLSLAIDPASAVANLREMQARQWLGAYGFYESVDFAPESSGADGDHTVVRSWMVHHQGMSLLALCNLMQDGALQDYFHAEPRVLATELLLHEKSPKLLPVEPVNDPEPRLHVLDERVAVPGRA